MSDEHYKTLGINDEATELEIKEAYHKLAKDNHPDRNKENPEAEKKLQDINAAYEALMRKVHPPDPREEHCKILGVSMNATREEIDEAYHKIMEAHEADADDPEATKRFMDINRAYDVLTQEKEDPDNW